MLIDSRSDGYATATRPHNSSTTQRPARVAPITRPDDIPAALDDVAALGRSMRRHLAVVPQATGHGAGAEVDGGVVLFDTSGLDAVAIDPRTRVATVGAGATWSGVNAAAEQHGLLGPAGSAPSVPVSGYTFGGGIGWLVRRDGLASGALRAVHYVDGSGRCRVAADDAPDPLDRDAIWAFRGAGGVGIAHTLEVDLFPAPDLHAGTLLWPASELPHLVAAWSSAIGAVGGGVSSSFSVLHIPPLPLFPEELRGRVAVHLAIADPDGPTAAAPLLDAVRAAARPVTDDWGPKDAAGPAPLPPHPPLPTPAPRGAPPLGAAPPRAPRPAGVPRGGAAPPRAPAGPPGSRPAPAAARLVMREPGPAAGAPPRRNGALVTPPGDFIYHAVGALDRRTRAEIDSGFARAGAVWSAADTSLTPRPWGEGSASAPAAPPADMRARTRPVAHAADPEPRLR